MSAVKNVYHAPEHALVHVPRGALVTVKIRAPDVKVHVPHAHQCVVQLALVVAEILVI